MNVVEFAGNTCGRIQQYFDGYVDNETLVETNHEILRHVETCARCRRVLEQRQLFKVVIRELVRSEVVPESLHSSVMQTVVNGFAPEPLSASDAQLRRLLQRAFSREPVPAEVLPSIREALRRETVPSVWTLDPAWPRRALAIAASLILMIVSLQWFTQQSAPARSEPSVFTLLSRLSAKASNLVQLAVLDHIHCALESPPMWQRELTLDEMQEDRYPTHWDPRPLGPNFIGLIPILETTAGPDFVAAQGHRCHTGLGRFFTHVILTRKPGEVVSVVLLDKRPGESLSALDELKVAQAAGHELVVLQDRGLEIAGFESSRYVGFVISNIPRDESLKLASNVVPPIQDFLNRL